MANFNVTLHVSAGKGGSAAFAATNGDGLASNDPLDVNGGDTVTFICASGSTGTAKFRYLSIFTSNADIDILAGGANVVRTVASGSLLLDSITGLNGGEISSDLFYIERQASSGSITAPTASSVTFNNPASANTTATVNLSATGSGGTLEYACEVGDTTPDNWQSGNTFTIARGSSGTVYAQARRSSTDTSNTVNASRPGFLTGDTAVAASSSNIANGATSASTTLSSATAGETYAVRVNDGSSNLATRTGNGSLSFTSSLPSSGNTSTYEIFVRRPTSTGGDGSTYTATNDTFTVSMSSPAQDTTPNAFDLADVGPVAAGTVATATPVTITGMDANCPCSVSGQGSPQLTVGSGGVWTTSSTINPNNTISVRLTAPTAYSSTHTATLTIGTETDDIIVTSAAAPSGSGGTGTTGGTGSYGVKIFDTNGSTTVLSPSTRYLVRLTDPTSISLAATTGSSTLIAVSGMSDLGAGNSDLIFEQFATVDNVPVTRESNGFRVTNNSGGVFNNIVYAVRF